MQRINRQTRNREKVFRVEIIASDRIHLIRAVHRHRKVSVEMLSPTVKVDQRIT